MSDPEIPGSRSAIGSNDARAPKGQGMTLLAVAVAMSVLAVIWLHRASQEEGASVARTAVSASSPASTEDIRVSAWVDDSRVRGGTTIRFWIAIQNTTAKRISGVSVLAFRRPNFALLADEGQRCWAVPAAQGSTQSDAVPVCVGEGPSRLPVALPAGAVVTVEGHLTARDEPGQFSIAAVVGWKDAAGVQRRTPISVGPVMVEDDFKKTAATVSLAAQNFLKDLGLPLVFLWLAYWVKQLEEARQEKKKKEDEETEAKRKQADERTAVIRQTWTQMLPKVHENAEKYYMPLMGYAAHASRTGNPGQRDSGLFRYLRFLGRMHEMSDVIGGFYLKTRAGENVVSAIWDAIRVRADERFTQPVRQELQVAIRTVGTFDRFDALPADSLIARERREFRVETFAVDAVLLRLFHLILTFETNLSYEFWYQEEEVFPAEEIETAMSDLEGRSFEAGVKYEDLRRSLVEYVAGVKSRRTVLPRVPLDVEVVRT